MKKVLFPILALVLALGLSLPMAMPAVADPDPGLVGLWHLDEGSGATTVSDSSGTVPANDGTIYGATPGVPGMFGNALSFDGDDYVELPASNTILNTDTFTVEAWFKTSLNHPVYGVGDKEGRLVNLHRMGTASTAVSLYVEEDKIGLLYYTGSAHTFVKHTVNYHDGVWHHIAVTHNATTYRLYYDGSEVASQDDAFGDFGTYPAYLGTYNSAERFFDGTIDEVRIWNEALSAGVIAEHAAAEMVLDKTMLEDGYLGDHVMVTLDVENPYTHNLTLTDEIPDDLRYIPGSYSGPGTPTVVDNTISVSVPPGAYTITFDVQVVEVQAEAVNATNWAYLKDGITVLDSDSKVITLHPYEGFEKTVEIIYEGEPNGIVEVNELVTWNMTITVPNNVGWNITDAVLKDNLGGELGMADDNVNNDRIGGTDDGANGDLGPASNTIPDGTLTIKTKGKTKKVQFKITGIGIDDGDPALVFVLGIFTDRNPSKWGQQCYTSPCLHYLNSGATLKFTDPGTGFQLSAHTCPLPVYVTDAKLTLENKNPSTWQIEVDARYGELYYSTEGDVFCYEFRGYGLEATTGYSLIYYADFEDRFNIWGGNNPGALIATGTASGGSLTMSGSIDLGIDLPDPSDANAYYHNYADPGDPHYTGDGYATAYGAKIWLVPSDCYDAGAKKVTSWSSGRFLFETDLITYDDTDVP